MFSLRNRCLTASELAASMNKTKETCVHRNSGQLALWAELPRKKIYKGWQIRRKSYSGPTCTNIGLYMTWVKPGLESCELVSPSLKWRTYSTELRCRAHEMMIDALHLPNRVWRWKCDDLVMLWQWESGWSSSCKMHSQSAWKPFHLKSHDWIDAWLETTSFCSKTVIPCILPGCVRFIFQKKVPAEILSLMPWPTQSPNLNPIELLWEKLG